MEIWWDKVSGENWARGGRMTVGSKMERGGGSWFLALPLAELGALLWNPDMCQREPGKPRTPTSEGIPVVRLGCQEAKWVPVTFPSEVGTISFLTKRHLLMDLLFRSRAELPLSRLYSGWQGAEPGDSARGAGELTEAGCCLGLVLGPPWAVMVARSTRWGAVPSAPAASAPCSSHWGLPFTVLHATCQAPY